MMRDSWTSMPVAAGVSGYLNRPRVVVGVSDDRAADAALRLGADIAETAALPLHLVRAFRPAEASATPPHDELDEEHRQRSMLSSAYGVARRLAPSTVVTAESVPGGVCEMLMMRTRGAHVLVLGARTDDDPGPIADWELDHAQCAVLVVNSAGDVVASAPKLGAGPVCPERDTPSSDVGSSTA
jgi:nucleotide-binding universal stress UspA family protein